MILLTPILSLVPILSIFSFAQAGTPSLERRQNGEECVVTTDLALISAGNDPTCSTVTIEGALQVSHGLNFSGIENKHFVGVDFLVSERA